MKTFFQLAVNSFEIGDWNWPYIKPNWKQDSNHLLLFCKNWSLQKDKEKDFTGSKNECVPSINFFFFLYQLPIFSVQWFDYGKLYR